MLARPRPMHSLDSDARIRKYLNLIAGHDRYIAAVISVLITRVHRSCRSVERGHVRVTSREIAMRDAQGRNARNHAWNGASDLLRLSRINIRDAAALICARVLRGIIGNERYLACNARGEVLINRSMRNRTRTVNRSAREMLTENNSGSLAKKTA